MTRIVIWIVLGLCFEWNIHTVQGGICTFYFVLFEFNTTLKHIDNTIPFKYIIMIMLLFRGKMFGVLIGQKHRMIWVNTLLPRLPCRQNVSGITRSIIHVILSIFFQYFRQLKCTHIRCSFWSASKNLDIHKVTHCSLYVIQDFVIFIIHCVLFLYHTPILIYSETRCV